MEHGPHVLTCAVSQLLMSWLNVLALWNMPAMFVTFAVFQSPMGWLKDVALENMAFMSVTELVSQPLMSWLKAWRHRTCYHGRHRARVPVPMGALKALDV